MIVGVMKEKTKLTPNGIKILMVESFVKINPTDPLMLAKQVARRKRNWPDSSGMSLVRVDVSRWVMKEILLFFMNRESEN